MFFSKKPPQPPADEGADDLSQDPNQDSHKIEPASAEASLRMRRSTADTAHLIGPGCVKLVGKMPIWKPVTGARLQLHPEYLRRVLCYGNVDFSTAVLRLLWRKGVQVVFLSPSGTSLLGKLQPAGGSPNLARLQHLAAEHPAFRLAMGKELVAAKIESQVATVRYYQQQGKGESAGKALRELKRQRARCEQVDSVATLLGVEGSATAIWFRHFASLVPGSWGFSKRVARPATDPVNALLSLGYSLAHHRCETLLAAADLDPRVGFLHDIRPGRASLACDLVEPLRVPLVDRMVLGMLSRKAVAPESFVKDGQAYRLQPDEFRRYLATFEQTLTDSKAPPSFHEQTVARIEDWGRRIRVFAGPATGATPC